MARAIFLTSDLMFSSRLLGAAQTFGLACQVVAVPANLLVAVTADCRLVLIDLGLAGLDLPAAVAAIRGAAPQAKVVAFGPHVDEALLASAKAAGCDLVLPRSKFHQQYVELLRGAAGL